MLKKLQQTKGRVVGVDAHSEKLVLCIMQRSPSGAVAEAKVLKTLTCTVSALEATFRRQTLPEDEIVLEATTNAFSIVERLGVINRNAFVVKSESVHGLERADRINDEIDARNIAQLWLSGFAKTVWVPDAKTRLYRDIFFGYRNTTKDKTRASNRIWAFCSGHGFKLPKRSRKTKVSEVRSQVLERNWDEDERFHVERLLDTYERICSDRDVYRKRIEDIVSRTPAMLKMFQVLGVSNITAFAVYSFIGDIRRFRSPKKLVSYVGLNPSVCDSGKYESCRRTSRYGRGDLKSLLIQSAHQALRSGQGRVHAWARRLRFSKGENKAVVALARKMLTFLWHILMGHPCPNVSAPQGLERKLQKLAGSVVSPRLDVLGLKSTKEWVRSVLESQHFTLEKT